MPLEISYSPVSIGLLRMWLHFAEAMKAMRALGQCSCLLLYMGASN